MNNIKKCQEILERKDADALLLLDEANMHYICGFSPSEGAVLVFKDGSAYHIVDSRYTEKAQRHSAENGLEVIEPDSMIYLCIAELFGEHNANSVIYENRTISLRWYEIINENLEGVLMIPLDNDLMEYRNCKEAEEIVYMKKANAIAESAFLELLNHIKVGKTEKEIAAYFDYLMAMKGSDGVSFDTIVLTGANSSMPHGVPSDTKIKDGDFLLFDFGATYRGYHSDMTRTIVVGSATDEMREHYQTVLDAQMAGIKAFNAGEKCKDVYKAAYDVLNEHKLAEYFRHSLGHGVGLEIHEGYNASSLSKDTYAVGNVSSIEPGIYLPDKYGIRIEDVCYLSPRGRENLSNITKRLIEI